MFGDPKYHFKRVEGAIIGFAVADALGVPVEFSSREERKRDPVYEMRSGGTHGQPAGTWSDDTSMTLCMVHSLIEKGIDYSISEEQRNMPSTIIGMESLLSSAATGMRIPAETGL